MSEDMSEDMSHFSQHTAAAAIHHRHLMAAQSFDSDLEFAYNLQLQEAINASLFLHPSSSASSSSSPPPPPQLPSASTAASASSSSSRPPPKLPFFASSSSSPPPPKPLSEVIYLPHQMLRSQQLLKLEQELADFKLSESESRRDRDDLDRRIHDRKLAVEIDRIPENEWEVTGDEYENPYGEGSSRTVNNNEMFRVYCKGLVEKLSGSKGRICGIGVAICDSRDELLFELKKPFGSTTMNIKCVELKALIEGLNKARELELDRVRFYCDAYPIYQYVKGRWLPKQRKVETLVNQVNRIQNKFTTCYVTYVARNDMKFAFKLARDAITSQMNRPAAESSNSMNFYETCVICLEDIDVSRIFSVDGCFHRYCYSCMKQHVEAKLLQGLLPKCPHENCDSELIIGSCRKFLTPKLNEIMRQRIKEASIPVSEKVYCPYPKCSALMSKTEVERYSGLARVKRRCMKCKNLFCIACKVPWHAYMNCYEYKRENPNGEEEIAKLKNLAEKKLWRQCRKCKHMIELAAGCYHMTCRCGYEFCYTCGAAWKDKKATCDCPLFAYDSDDEDEEVEEEEEEEEEEEGDYDFDYDYYESDYDSDFNNYD